MENIILNEQEYKLIENIRDGYSADEVKSRCTDYFNEFDYIVGDWAYGKLRLKGFYEENNKQAKEINNINLLKDYLKNNCAFDCRYFVLKKVYKK
ncbi:MAG: DUF1027 domain-containing protein [Bacilli bacterium]|nr:DUF1027 domain-containing protein [Bacilli bacterium]